MTDQTMRKKHTKSRFGCKECKRRRIKCDEARPKCALCSKYQRQCLYLHTGGLPSPSPSSVPCTSAASSSESPAVPDSQKSSFSPACPQKPRDSILVERYSLLHLDLLEHFKNRLAQPMTPSQPELELALKLTAEEAVTTPYVMDELLAFSAAHKSTLPGESQHFFAAEATRLQTRALNQFNLQTAEVSDENYLAIFCFSTLLGQHALFDCLLSHRDPATVLDRFSQCLSLNRGVRAIASQAWPKIQEKLQARVSLDLVCGDNLSMSASGSECGALLQMLDKRELSHTSTQACREAVQVLQSLLDSQSSSSSDHRGFVVVQEWPVRIPNQYVHLLNKRCPEALVILAYYGVLLHRARDYWVVGDSGRFLIQAVRNHLGPYWEDWLEWPTNIANA